jgi:hypothetical protein
LNELFAMKENQRGEGKLLKNFKGYLGKGKDLSKMVRYDCKYNPSTTKISFPKDWTQKGYVKSTMVEMPRKSGWRLLENRVSIDIETSLEGLRILRLITFVQKHRETRQGTGFFANTPAEDRHIMNKNTSAMFQKGVQEVDLVLNAVESNITASADEEGSVAIVGDADALGLPRCHVSHSFDDYTNYARVVHAYLLRKSMDVILSSAK